jgi:hypothetical protein
MIIVLFLTLCATALILASIVNLATFCIASSTQEEACQEIKFSTGTITVGLAFLIVTYAPAGLLQAVPNPVLFYAGAAVCLTTFAYAVARLTLRMRNSVS